MICPNCGKAMTRVEYSGSGPGGERKESLCCHVGLDLLDNWAVLELLPEEMLTAALEADHAAAEAFFEGIGEAGRKCNDRLARWQAENLEKFKDPALEPA